uniref:Nuclear transport factor 2 n=1 Tax=Cuerna arida TaxID=1464854 RepID=A0A1B6FAL0_9HEMI
MATDKFRSIGEAFVQQYYTLFDDATRRHELANFYSQTNAKMSFEGDTVFGKDFIIAKIMNLPFREIKREFTVIDCQPLINDGVFVQVIGRLKTDDDPPNSFSQVFILQVENGSYFIHNDNFRLVLHNSG